MVLFALLSSKVRNYLYVNCVGLTPRVIIFCSADCTTSTYVKDYRVVIKIKDRPASGPALQQGTRCSERSNFKKIN